MSQARWLWAGLVVSAALSCKIELSGLVQTILMLSFQRNSNHHERGIGFDGTDQIAKGQGGETYDLRLWRNREMGYPGEHAHDDSML